MALSTRAVNSMNNGWDFQLGRYISRAFELVNKNAGGFILLTLALFIMSWLVGLFTSFISTLLVGAIGGFVAISLGQIISQVCSSFINAPLTLGYSIGAHQTATTEHAEVGDFFQGFSRIGPLFTTLLFSSLITLISALPGLYIMHQGGLDFTKIQELMQNGDELDLDSTMVFLGLVVALVPAIYFTVSYSWALNYAWFFNLSAWESLEASRKTISNNFFGMLLLLIVGFFILIGGFLAFCLGILYALPVFSTSSYAAFADATGVESADKDEFEEDFKHFDPQ
jgi:hypothetical protein